MSERDAAVAAGIDPEAMRRWLKRHREIRPLLEAEKQRGKLAALERIIEAGKDSRYWTASAWFLERNWPDQYGQRQRLELDVRTLALTLQREFGAAGIALDDATMAAQVEAAAAMLAPPA